MRWRCRNSARGSLAALLLAACSCASSANADEFLTDASAATVPASQLQLILPTVNGVPHDVALLLRDEHGHYHADAETLREWRVAPPYPPPLAFDGHRFHPLDAFPGLVAEVTERSMTATVDVPPELLIDTRRSISGETDTVLPEAAFGAYLDYDVAYTAGESEDGDGFSSLLRPTVFTRHGNLAASVVRRPAGAWLEPDWVRLETTWSRDDPSRMRTLRLGDAITPFGSWARSLRFAGFQLGTNFATRPETITFPQPSIAGSAAMPTALDILVNGTLRSRTEVPSGVFRIDDVPVVTGAGQIQVVSRDLLGREQIVTQDFYVSERLLRRGLNEYSVNAGALRENFGLASDDYGDFLIAGVLRRGLSDVLTIEGRAEGTADVQTAGVSLALGIGRYGVTSASLAFSDAATSGALWQIGHEYRGRFYRAQLRLQGSDSFVQPGLDVLRAWPTRQVVASGGRNLGRQGSLGLSYVSERFAAREDDRELVTISYSRSLRYGLRLSASVSHIGGSDGGPLANVIVSRVLGPRSSASTALNLRRDAASLRFDHRYNLPTGPGYGYRASVVAGDDRAQDLEVAVNTEHAHYSAEIAQRNNARGWRAQTRGSVALLDGGVFASREINEGFAVVDAGGFEGVRIYLENRNAGTTNSRGQLLVPGLRPYERNLLRIESDDLPLTARITDPTMRVAPYYRSGAIASFGVESSASVLMRVVGADGAALGEGARARVDDGAFSLPVGLDGRLYIDDARSQARVEIMHSGGRCAFTLGDVPSDATGIPDLGQVVCTAIDDGSGSSERELR
jgi:outer membrane usher protein